MKRPARSTIVMPTIVTKKRCAVYTRKSTDEGLDKEFTTLDAQRDACEAYVLSQQAEGWTLEATRYDDGGVSGATFDRPALRRLLNDIAAGKIDVVVVYKVDRLSRSLIVFTKIIEIFEEHKVTFVAISQSFNTTTSIGRLILHILLSFSQFERETIGERIRDKIAATRKRGNWTGGKVLLGFQVIDCKLVVNELEAKRVRRVFELFAESGSGAETTRRLQADGITSKTGRLLNRSDVYKIVGNRLYVGEVTHKGNVYPGEHQPVVSRALWDQVHTILQESPRARSNKKRAQSPALLRGLIFGSDGRALSPTHTRRRGRLYRYYVSQSVLKATQDIDPNAVRRISAATIETAVIDQVRVLLRQPEVIVGTWIAAREELPDLSESDVRKALCQLDPLWNELFPAEQVRIIRLLVERVEVGPEGADIRLRVEGLTSLVKDLTQQSSSTSSVAV